MLKFFAGVAVVLVVVWLGVSFIVWDLDVSNWPKDARALAVCMAVFGSFIGPLYWRTFR